MGIKKPYITIITPTYNRADLLEYAILSIINQKHDIQFDRELIIVDDGSTDNTKQLVEKYIKKYPKNIQYYYQKNSGIPGVGRNTGLDYMNKKSDYIIFLDSDDELKNNFIYISLIKRKEITKNNEYNDILGFYFLCEDEHGNVICNQNLFQGKKEKKLDYSNFLRGDFNFELIPVLKSSFFLNNKELRFSDKVITEGYLWSKMRKYLYNRHMNMYIYDYIGRFYRTNHSSEKQITKTVSIERFRKNALGNQEILNMIGKDLLSFGYKKIYSEYLFRIGVNRILYGDKSIGLSFLRKALKYKFSLKILGIYLLSLMSTKIISHIYSFYIN